MADVMPQRCPACDVVALNKHCPSPSCPWHRCRNKSCRAVLHLAANRGIRPLDARETRWQPFRITS